MGSFHNLLLLSAILFTSCGSVSVYSRVPVFSTMAERHSSWMAEHNKVYETEAERDVRFQIFQQNADYIEQFNARNRNSTYEIGINQFTHLTNEERLARFTGYRPPRVWRASPNYKPVDVRAEDLPKSWDWREKGAVTPVKAQTCNNCWLFVGVAEVESVNFIATQKLQVLSEQEIMDCDDLPMKGGCQGGWIQETYEYVRHYSLTTGAEYPNKVENQPCTISKRGQGEGRSARVSSFVNMPAFLSDEELMQAVMKQPVAIGVDVSSPDFGAYKSGVFTGPCDFKLNHAMVIVGWGETDEGLKYWIMRNSWGEGWGDAGYIKIQRGTGRKEGLCGVNLTPSYPVY